MFAQQCGVLHQQYLFTVIPRFLLLMWFSWLYVTMVPVDKIMAVCKLEYYHAIAQPATFKTACQLAF